MLLSTPAEQKTYKLASNMTYLELSAVPDLYGRVCGSLLHSSYRRVHVPVRKAEIKPVQTVPVSGGIFNLSLTEVCNEF